MFLHGISVKAQYLVATKLGPLFFQKWKGYKIIFTSDIKLVTENITLGETIWCQNLQYITWKAFTEGGREVLLYN